MIHYEDAVCKALNIPSIPKKKWDGKKSFKTGVAVIALDKEKTRLAYAVVTFDETNDEQPRVQKVFSIEPFYDILDDEIYIVPDYMDNDVESMDLDDESKQAAQRLLDEANELESMGIENEITMPENEYFFDQIHDDEQAQAFIKDYNRRNKLRGKVPTTHDALIMRLSVIYSEMNKKTKKQKTR